MYSSRVDKYRDLRSGLKDEVGINRENDKDIKNIVNDEDDDFLRAINSHAPKVANLFEDTLPEAMTFKQMQEESSEEINQALRNAKASVGKEAQYNTRMDIFNKIREPEKQVVRVNSFDNMETSQFDKGFFVKKDDEMTLQDALDPKKSMTLMERLASMSPEEDVKKAKIILDKESEEKSEIELEIEEPVDDSANQRVEPTASLEDMLKQIKEKDQRAVAKALEEKEATGEVKPIKKENIKDKEIKEDKGTEKIAKVLNYIIIFLVVVFVGLCIMIAYSLFF